MLVFRNKAFLKANRLNFFVIYKVNLIMHILSFMHAHCTYQSKQCMSYSDHLGQCQIIFAIHNYLIKMTSMSVAVINVTLVCDFMSYKTSI